MAVHSLSPSATCILFNVHCLNIFLCFVFLHWNLDFWIPWKPRWSGSPDDALLHGNYRLSSHWPREKGLEPAAATGLSTAYRPGLSLCRSFTSTPGTYWYMTLSSCCKFYKSTWRLFSEWLQKCIFLSLSLCRINTYCWGGGKTDLHDFTV